MSSVWLGGGNPDAHFIGPVAVRPRECLNNIQHAVLRGAGHGGIIEIGQIMHPLIGGSARIDALEGVFPISEKVFFQMRGRQTPIGVGCLWTDVDRPNF